VKVVVEGVTTALVFVLWACVEVLSRATGLLLECARLLAVENWLAVVGDEAGKDEDDSGGFGSVLEIAGHIIGLIGGVLVGGFTGVVLTWVDVALCCVEDEPWLDSMLTEVGFGEFVVVDKLDEGTMIGVLIAWVVIGRAVVCSMAEVECSLGGVVIASTVDVGIALPSVEVVEAGISVYCTEECIPELVICIVATEEVVTETGS
jgi:hypothetical protein